VWERQSRNTAGHSFFCRKRRASEVPAERADMA
jgi:hypothetical protein